MSIRFYCPNCGDFLEVDDHLEGREGECPVCGQLITIPEEKKNSFFPKDQKQENCPSSSFDNPFESPNAPESDNGQAESYVDSFKPVRAPFLVKDVIKTVLLFYQRHFILILLLGLPFFLANLDTLFNIYGIDYAESGNTSDTLEAFLGNFRPRKLHLLFYLSMFLNQYLLLWLFKKIIQIFLKDDAANRAPMNDRQLADPAKDPENTSDQSDQNVFIKSDRTHQKSSLPGLGEFVTLIGANFIFSLIVLLIMTVGMFLTSPLIAMSSSDNIIIALPLIAIILLILFYLFRIVFSLSFYPFFIIDQKAKILQSIKSSWYFAANRSDMTRCLSLFFFLLGGSGLIFTAGFLALDQIFSLTGIFTEAMGNSWAEGLALMFYYFVFVPFFAVLFSAVYLKMTGKLTRSEDRQ